MPDRYTSVTETRAAARAVKADGNITEAQFKQMTDGTVSRTDIANAKRAVEKAEKDMNYWANQVAAYGGENAKANYTIARDNLLEAQKLVSAVNAQYASQGYLETGKENAKDAVWGT